MILGLLRTALGLIYVLFVPGFAATWALFPKREDISDLERVTFSFALSIALVTLSVVLMNYFLYVPITAVNSFMIILFVTLLCALVAVVRMKKII